MAAKKTTKDSAVAEKGKNSAEEPQATGTPKKVADLSIGDIVLVPGFDGPRTIRGAARVTDGADAGKLDVALRDETGLVEHARFGPDEEVQVVGKAQKGGKDGAVPAGSAARKTGSRSKATKATKPEGAKKTKKAKEPKPPKEKKPSALDAAAKVLGEKGEPMNCQEMIKEMSEKGYWKSPSGLTPHATLYSAIAREIKVKGKAARFKKADKGKFALRSNQTQNAGGIGPPAR